MFQASSCPSPGATTTAVAASGLPIAIRDTVLQIYGCRQISDNVLQTLQNNISYLSATVKLQNCISYDNR
jgi:hypothetical protein